MFLVQPIHFFKFSTNLSLDVLIKNVLIKQKKVYAVTFFHKNHTFFLDTKFGLKSCSSIEFPLVCIIKYPTDEFN